MRSSYKHRVTFWLTFMTCCITHAQDHIIQKVIIDSGSEYEGYISSQKIGSEEIVFKSFCSTIVLDKSKFKNVTISKENVETIELSNEWKIWAKNNNAFSIKGNREVLPLSTIIADKTELRDVYVKDLGEKIKYVIMKEEFLKLSFDSISEIRGILRPDTILSGLDRVYELKNGNRNSGQYYGEKPKEFVKILSEDGPASINKNDIVKCIIKPVNKEQNIFEQAPLLDYVKLKTGNIYEGIVTEQNFVDKDQNSWFFTLMLSNDESMKMIKFIDITEVGKIKNSRYKPISDVKLEKGKCCLNDSSLVLQNLNECTQMNNSYYLISDSTNTREIDSGNNITFYTNLGKNVKSDQFIIVPIKKHLEQESDKKKSKDKNIISKESYELGLHDILARNIQPVKRSGPTKNGTTRFSYTVSPGDYVFIDFVNLKYTILIIK